MAATGFSQTTNTQLSAAWVAVPGALFYLQMDLSRRFHRCFIEVFKASVELPIVRLTQGIPLLKPYQRLHLTVYYFYN